ncbi:MAG: hypothetical protein JNJ77_18955 [Planctomycetia bacterium]|nr:hypothetical protein [Planctomycetia bacterium]
MNEPISLESLAHRVAALEAAIFSKQERKKDWRRSLGIAGDSELMKQIDEEGRKIREADREAAHRGEQDA